MRRARQAPASPLRGAALQAHSPHATGAPAASSFAAASGYGQPLQLGAYAGSYGGPYGQALSAPSSPLRAGASAKFGSVPTSFDRATLPDRAALLASMAARGSLLEGPAQGLAPVPRAPSPGGFARASAFSGSLSAGYPPDYAPDAMGGGVPLSVPLRSAPLPGGEAGSRSGGGVDAGVGLTNPVGSGGFTVTSGTPAPTPTSPFQQLGVAEPFSGGGWEMPSRPGGPQGG